MAVTLDIKVVPKSGRCELLLDKTNRIRCYLKSAPEKGLANRELLNHIAKLAGVTRSNVEIIKGLTSRNKTVKIHTDHEEQAILNKLGIPSQMTLCDKKTNKKI